MKNVFTKEAKIGLVSIVSLALLYLGINYLKGINLFKPTNHYVVACTNVKGVTVSSPVFVEGFKVGLVREIVYDYDAVDKISIDISLEDHMKINKGSYITIVNSFLGGGELHIHLNKYVDDYLKPGDTIEGRMESDMMQSVQEKILPQVELLLPKIDSPAQPDAKQGCAGHYERSEGHHRKLCRCQHGFEKTGSGNDRECGECNIG